MGSTCTSLPGVVACRRWHALTFAQNNVFIGGEGVLLGVAAPVEIESKV